MENYKKIKVIGKSNNSKVYLVESISESKVCLKKILFIYYLALCT